TTGMEFDMCGDSTRSESILGRSEGGMGARGLPPARRRQRSPDRPAVPMASPTFRRRAPTCPGGSPMPMMAVAFPILPGKTAEWRAWMDEINGPRRDEFDASRKAAGVHERTFLQQTP